MIDRQSRFDVGEIRLKRFKSKDGSLSEKASLHVDINCSRSELVRFLQNVLKPILNSPKSAFLLEKVWKFVNHLKNCILYIVPNLNKFYWFGNAEWRRECRKNRNIRGDCPKKKIKLNYPHNHRVVFETNYESL